MAITLDTVSFLRCMPAFFCVFSIMLWTQKSFDSPILRPGSISKPDSETWKPGAPVQHWLVVTYRQLHKQTESSGS